jgi:nicotinamide-nucleotide amidase
MRIQLLLTGSELMAGDTLDSNSAAIAQHLGRHGMAVYRKVTISDDIDLLCQEIEHLSRDSDVLIVNGGLGPTIDDLTAEALARATGRELQAHPEAMAHLEAWLGKRNYPLNDANRKQAVLPAGVEIVANANGSAVGFSIRFNDCEIYCTPGVPSELLMMLEQEILPQLVTKFSDIEPVSITRLRLFGMGESSVQQMIHDSFPEWPEELELGFRAGLPMLELKLKTQASGHQQLKAQWLSRLQQLIGDYIVGRDDIDLAQSVVALLKDKQLKLSTAESCTGGLIASQIVEVAGASTVFEAGYVSYSNSVKQSALGVSAATLERHGAVSEAVVREMADGAARNSASDLAIAVSGIAGPDGGSKARPVGTVWVAWGLRDTIQAREFLIPGERKFIQTLVAAIALDLTRRTLLGIDTQPRYFRERGPGLSK